MVTLIIPTSELSDDEDPHWHKPATLHGHHACNVFAPHGEQSEFVAAWKLSGTATHILHSLHGLELPGSLDGVDGGVDGSTVVGVVPEKNSTHFEYGTSGDKGSS